jgi:hypothetical protein
MISPTDDRNGSSMMVAKIENTTAQVASIPKPVSGREEGMQGKQFDQYI